VSRRNETAIGIVDARFGNNESVLSQFQRVPEREALDHLPGQRGRNAWFALMPPTTGRAAAL
jgi:hypothetical protein